MAMSVVYSTFGGEVVSENRGGTERDYGRDGLGSTAALYDSTSAMTDEWEYYPYGEVATHTGSSTTPFTFVGTLGYYMDAATRYYVRARSYLASLGRWTSVDPLWPREAAYAYVGGMPTGRVDPSGMLAIVPILCAVACGGCLVCLAGFIGSCSDCGSDAACWAECLKRIIDNLPAAAKIACGALCGGCALCLGAFLVRAVRKPKPVIDPLERPLPPFPYGLPAHRLCHQRCLAETRLDCAERYPFDPQQAIACWAVAQTFCALMCKVFV